jgi:hypothetical protein
MAHSKLRSLFALLFLFALACGDDGGGSAIDAGPGGGGICTAVGSECTANPECCSGACGSDGLCAEPAGQCELAGATCISGASCCSGLCVDDGAGNLSCGAGFGSCQPLGQSCDTATDCCSLGCSGGICSEDLCSTGGTNCLADSDCCSNVCGTGGQCEVPAGCFLAGESCDADSKCCSANCIDFGGGDQRCGASGACRVVGEICTAAEDCCGFNCVIGDGETYGQCETLPGFSECKSVGEVCENDTTCCSLSCRDNGTGFQSCQYLSGCRPMGELCRQGADCCNYAVQSNEDVCNKTVNDDVGRCQNPGGDAPAGEVCGDAEGNPQGSNTCAGGQGQGATNVNCNSSGPDLPYRCDGGDDPCLTESQSCALGADCCSGVCAPDAGGDLVCDPPDQCRVVGDTCTANGDCCSNFCDPQTLLCATGAIID